MYCVDNNLKWEDISIWYDYNVEADSIEQIKEYFKEEIEDINRK